MGLEGNSETLRHLLEREPEDFDKFLMRERVLSRMEGWDRQDAASRRQPTVENFDDDDVSVPQQEQHGRPPAEFIIGATPSEEEILRQEQIEDEFGPGSLYPDDANQGRPRNAHYIDTRCWEDIWRYELMNRELDYLGFGPHPDDEVDPDDPHIMIGMTEEQSQFYDRLNLELDDAGFGPHPDDLARHQQLMWRLQMERERWQRERWERWQWEREQ